MATVITIDPNVARARWLYLRASALLETSHKLLASYRALAERVATTITNNPKAE